MNVSKRDELGCIYIEGKYIICYGGNLGKACTSCLLNNIIDLSLSKHLYMYRKGL